MAGYIIKNGAYYTVTTCEHQDYLLENPEINPVAAAAQPFCVYSEGEFYYFAVDPKTKTWLRARLVINPKDKQASLSWSELVFSSSTVRVLLAAEPKGNDESILSLLLEQRERFQTQLKQEAQNTPVTAPSSSSETKSSVYETAELAPIDIHNLKAALEMEITVPMDKSKEFLQLVDYAQTLDLEQQPEGLDDLPEDMKEVYPYLQRHLHPYYINMLKLTATQHGIPTFYSVQNYLLWILTGKMNQSRLPPEIGQAVVGSLRDENFTVNLEHPDNQAALLKYVYDVYNNRGSNYHHITDLLSLEEWILIKNQFSTPMVLTDQDSTLYDDFVQKISAEDGLFDQNYPDFLGFKRSLVNKCNKYIKIINEKLQNQEYSHSAGIIRSCSLEVQSTFLQTESIIDKGYIGAILSTIPLSSWPRFLEEVGFKSFEEAPYQLNSLKCFTELFITTPVRIWPELIKLKGFKQRFYALLKKDGALDYTNVHDLLWLISPDQRRSLEVMFKFSQYMSSKKINLSYYREYINSFSEEDKREIAMSQGMKIFLNSFINPDLTEIQLLFDMYQNILLPNDVIIMMKSFFFRREVILKGNLIKFASNDKTELLREFLKDPEHDADLHLSIRRPYDLVCLIEIMLGLTTRIDQILSNETLMKKFKGFDLDMATKTLIFKKLGKLYYNKLVDNFDSELETYQIDDIPTSFATFISNDTTGSFITTLSSLPSLRDFLEVLTKLDSEKANALLELPGLQSLTAIDEQDAQTLRDCGRFIQSLPSETLYNFLTSKDLDHDRLSIITCYIYRIFPRLDKYLTSFLDEPEFKNDLVSLFQNRERDRIIKLSIHMSRGQFTRLLNSKFMKEYLLEHLVLENFLAILKDSNCDLTRIELLVDHEALLQLYVRFISQGKGSSIINLIRNSHATVKNLNTIIEATEHGIREYEHLYKRTHYFWEPVPYLSVERDYINGLKQGIRRLEKRGIELV